MNKAQQIARRLLEEPVDNNIFGSIPGKGGEAPPDEPPAGETQCLVFSDSSGDGSTSTAIGVFVWDGEEYHGQDIIDELYSMMWQGGAHGGAVPPYHAPVSYVFDDVDASVSKFGNFTVTKQQLMELAEAHQMGGEIAQDQANALFDRIDDVLAVLNAQPT